MQTTPSQLISNNDQVLPLPAHRTFDYTLSKTQQCQFCCCILLVQQYSSSKIGNIYHLNEHFIRLFFALLSFHSIELAHFQSSEFFRYDGIVPVSH